MLTAERGAAFGLRIALLLVPPIHDMLAAALTRSALMAVEARGSFSAIKEFARKIPVWRSKNIISGQPKSTRVGQRKAARSLAMLCAAATAHLAAA